MAQVTLYLDDATRALMEDAARAEGVSKSRWVADLIRRHTRPTWPEEWYSALGSFPDFPLRADVPSVDDAERIGF